MRTWIPAVSAAAVLAALFVVSPAPVAPAKGDHEAGASVDRKPDENNRGHGPPSWAGSGPTGRANDQTEKSAWRRLRPEARSELMTRLSRDHAEGMKAFRDCVEARRPNCEKPLPPGHAKTLGLSPARR